MQPESEKRVVGRPFVKGDPRAGRPKGSIDRVARETREFIAKFIKDKEYRENLRARIFAGEAPHLETLMWLQLLGKPKERIELTAEQRTALEIFVVDSRNGGNGSNGGNGHHSELPDEPVTIDVEPEREPG